jgi:hypothetical protein
MVKCKEEQIRIKKLQRTIAHSVAAVVKETNKKALD